jgi:hypothetical protein
VVDASTRFITEQETPDTGTLSGDVTAIVNDLAERLWTARWSSVLPSIVDVAERDRDFAKIHAGIQAGHQAPLRTVIKRAIARGELPKRTNVSAMVAALIGSLFYMRWFARQPLDARFVKAIIGFMLDN